MKKREWIIVFLLIFGISHILAAECGDVNSDGQTDIIDALLVAQYYVGLIPSLDCENDPTLPTGNFVINNDNDNTVSTAVTLNIEIAGVFQMRFGNTLSELEATSWEAYSGIKEWSLSPGIGLKTVYGEFLDFDLKIYEVNDTIRKIKKITASDGTASDNFGKNVAVSSDVSTVVVGVNADDGLESGSVYVYNGTNWGTETKITVSGRATEDTCGYSVAVSSDGGIIVVGAFWDGNGVATGSGSVFVYSGTNWGTETKIKPSDGAEHDNFGNSVAVSSDGSTVIVGAYADDDNGTDSGSVYVYDGANWGTETKITASDGAADDEFGRSLAVSSDGSTVIVGAHDDDDNGTYSGSVYIYNGTNWGTEIKITASDGAANDYFGNSVAVSSDGSTVIVGAHADDDNGTSSGSVYMYNGTNWGTETKITAGDGTAEDFFGRSVAVSSDGSTVIVGANRDDDNGESSGSVYVYNGTNWGIETKITASDGAVGDWFGVSLAVFSDGSTIVVGALGDDDNGVNSGSVYIIPLE